VENLRVIILFLGVGSFCRVLVLMINAIEGSSWQKPEKKEKKGGR
jgi:hypothetical protein